MGSFLSSLVNPDAAAAATDANSAVIAVHSKEAWNDHWIAHKNSNKLLVIDFSATWCGPCRAIEPTFKALSARFADASFVKIDVDELSEVAQRWMVQGMPTFVFVKEGKEVARVVGANRGELEGKVAQLMA
ncbi:hypothetical protein HPP92_018235 [Vanilla planifolia]|uniref:Thioredoxin domain-containing protein n=1 Tax=Vanilla planifolia TaxID=51239 RepID=A0A835UP71_VANPL|nr:hypothetical protein HPP92_018235 [Vanilla planifolia]